MKTPRELWAAMGAIAALLIALAVLTADEGAGESRPGEPPAPLKPRSFGNSLADPVPYDGRSPREPAEDERRVLVELPRPALGERADPRALSGRQARDYVANLRDESAALRSALEARGLELRDVVTYERTWNGFAATVATRDLARLVSAGLRTRAVRRFYPAVSEPVLVSAPAAAPAPPADAPLVALLAGGLRGRVGYDAVDRDGDPAPGPDPRDARRSETSALGPAAVLEAGGRRVLALRVSALRADAEGRVDEYARTDELLAGLERAVDPDGDGDPRDAATAAVVAVNAPYAGFAGSPEARAAAAAVALGTEVVASPGHEAAGLAPYGTIGSPAAEDRVTAVAPAPAPDGTARSVLRVDELTVRGAAVLAGRPPRRALRTSAVVDGERPEELEGLQGRIALVRAGANPPAQAAAAAAAGAEAVLLAQPRAEHALAAMPAGRVGVPVLGITGEAAEAVLAAGRDREVRADPARLAADARPGVAFGGRAPSRFASRGPAYSGAVKPEALAPAGVVAAGALISGGAVAAASSVVRPVAVRRAPTRPPGPARITLGRPQLLSERGRTTGVRFTLGSFDRGDPGARRPTRVVPADRLELVLVDAAGRVVRRLTPAGGELGLLPAEYAYTLPRAALRSLPAGRNRFRIRAWAPRQRRATEVRSAAF